MSHLEHFSIPEFPNSVNEFLIETSADDQTYNCIAWAYGISDKWFWPDNNLYSYWPPTVPNEENVSAFIQLFGEVGYEECQDGDTEPGYEKIAIYTDANGIPTHAARQLPNGRWTSKLGYNIDIEHSIFSLDGGFYGNATVFMKRERPAQVPPFMTSREKKALFKKISRNKPCPCGSGKKYKRCHGK